MNKSITKKVWGASPAGTTHCIELQPGTKDFFESVVKKRSTMEMPWLYDVVPFSMFKGKRTLEVGCGAGYDAYEFCCNNAHYVGIDITPENIERTKKHLGFYDFHPQIIEADAEDLPFENSTFDSAFSNGVLHHTPDIKKSFNEVNRVLKEGGEFWVILYNKHSIFHWLYLFLFDHILRFGFLKRTFKERLAMIEYTTSDELPIVNVYSRTDLVKLLENAGFDVENTWVRKLTKDDMPEIPLVSYLWKHIPQGTYNKIGEYLGWYVIAKAIKNT